MTSASCGLEWLVGVEGLISSTANIFLAVSAFFLIISLFIFIQDAFRLTQEKSILQRLSSVFVDSWAISRFFLLLLLSAISFSHYLGDARVIHSITLLPASSWIERQIYNITFSISVIEYLLPSLFAASLISCLIFSKGTKKGTKKGTQIIFVILSAILLQSAMQDLFLYYFSPFDAVCGNYEKSGMILVSLIYLSISFSLCVFAFKELCNAKNKTKTCIPLVPLFLFATAFYFVLPGSMLAQEKATRNFQIGAHYYSWFPANWKSGYVGQKLIPPIHPELGEYSSDSLDVFKKHVSWAKEAGIDYFIFDWWAQRKEVRRNIYQKIKADLIPKDFKFALHYESHDLKEKGDPHYAGEMQNMVFIDADRADRLKKHWLYLARHYMGHESYLRINGRPVLYIYASRHLVGDVKHALQNAREYVFKHTGYDLYLVGDEVFFNVIGSDSSGYIYLLKEQQPLWGRFNFFDAITTYNSYDATRTYYGGEEGVEKFFTDTRQLYDSYAAYAKRNKQLFIPNVMPGYNDRGVRLHKDHYVLPRVFGYDNQSFFKRSLEQLGADYLNQPHSQLVITSWNEWNEGTQIEPSNITELSFEDITGVEMKFSQGHASHGYGCNYLEEINDFKRQLYKSRGDKLKGVQ